MLKQLFLLVTTFIFTSAFGQRDEEIKAYVEKYKNISIEEMKQYGIPASITLAQGIHESAAGKSKLAQNSNNHFGIKCHKDWQGKGYNHDDDKPQECFRVYDNPEESFRDHSKFLLGRTWYKPLFSLNMTDYKGWAHGLKKAGYATNPKYAYVLIDLIEKYNLHQYDVISDAVPIDNSMAKENVPSDNNVPCGNMLNINGSKAIVFEAGKTIDEICRCAGISTFQVYLFNDADVRYSFREGEFVYLSPKKTFSDRGFVVTEKNTSYRELAQEHGVQLSALLRYNDVSINKEIFAGKKVYLSDPSTADAAPKQTSNYSVKKGDTLYSIAKLFELTTEDLIKLNNLSDVNLSIGQVLYVSQP
jgi:LysM repeat protein